MKKSILIFSFFAFLLFSNVISAQESPRFPTTGTFQVQTYSNPNGLDFNQVILNETSFSILQDGQLVKTYSISGEDKSGIRVTQQFPTISAADAASQSFGVSIESISPTEIAVQLILPSAGRWKENLTLTRITD